MSQLELMKLKGCACSEENKSTPMYIYTRIKQLSNIVKKSYIQKSWHTKKG